MKLKNFVNKDGVRVVDPTELVDAFAASEGDIESWTGRIGSGKTYGATRRVLEDLKKGRVVYVNWHIDVSHLDGDERNSFMSVLAHIVFFRKRFYKIDYAKNLHYFDLDSENVVDFIANLTDCMVYADEGQDIFDSYEGTRMSKAKRKSLTRTRHLNKTLVIISQRPQAIAVTARANVAVFHRHVKAMQLPSFFTGKTLFKVYSTEDIDNNNMPIFTTSDPKGRQKLTAPLTEWYWSSPDIFRAYNTHYLRGGMKKSQDVHFEAYDLNLTSKIVRLFSLLLSPFRTRIDSSGSRGAIKSAERAAQ